MADKMTHLVDGFVLIAFSLALFIFFSAESQAQESVKNAASPLDEARAEVIIEQFDRLGFQSLISPVMAREHAGKEQNPERFVLHFETGQYYLKGKELQVLLRHARFLASNPNVLLLVAVYAGPDVDKQDLNRAENVRAQLLRNGVPAEQILVEHLNYQPVAHGLKGKQRVELEYLVSLL